MTRPSWFEAKDDSDGAAAPDSSGVQKEDAEEGEEEDGDEEDAEGGEEEQPPATDVCVEDAEPARDVDWVLQLSDTARWFMSFQKWGKWNDS